MNCRPEIRDYLLAARMRRWLEIIRCPLLDTTVPRWKARRNYWALVRRYPQLAARIGYTAALAVESPLHHVPPAEPEVPRPSCPPSTLTGTKIGRAHV